MSNATASLPTATIVSFEESVVMQLEDIITNLHSDQSGSFTRHGLFERVSSIGDFTADVLVICIDTIDDIFAKGNPKRLVSSYTLKTQLEKTVATLRAA